MTITTIDQIAGFLAENTAKYKGFELLLAEKACELLKALGKDVPAETIFKFLTEDHPDLSILGRRDKGIRVSKQTNRDDAKELFFSVSGGWTVRVNAPSVVFLNMTGYEHPSVETLYSADGKRENAKLQDVPAGIPAQIILGVGHLRDAKDGDLTCFAYVHKEVHYSDGEKWNPSPDRPCEVHYYESGQVRHLINYPRGKIGSPDPNMPCIESFWENGQVQAIEFGDEKIGRQRPVSLGPSYAEYFPNGVAAVEVFSQRDPKGRNRVVRWRCRRFDGAEREPGKFDMDVIQSTELSLTPCGDDYDKARELGGIEGLATSFFLRHGKEPDWEGGESPRGEGDVEVVPSGAKLRVKSKGRGGRKKAQRSSDAGLEGGR